MQGNLGTGDFKEVSKDNKIKINEKIGNAKIIDYIFADAQTFLLTDAGRIYASGYGVDDRNNKGIRTIFREIKLYNKSKIKVTSLKVIYNANTCASILNDKKAKCHIKSNFLTSDKDKKYIFSNLSTANTPALAHVGTWKKDYLYNEYEQFAEDLIYQDKQSKNTFYEVHFNVEGKRITSFLINKNKQSIVRSDYKNGVISQKRQMNEKKKTVIKYKNGLPTSKKIISYKNYKKPNPSAKYSRYAIKQVLYTYEQGKVNIRVIKKLSNKQLKLFSEKVYHRNKKGELKSNKNGKAYAYVTFYKKGKITALHKHIYNNEGKVSKIVKFKVVR